MSITTKEMAKATLSNYIHLVIKIIASLVLVRIMFLGLPKESYGFWALLWSIFGYTVLLDFGLGVTIQKKAAVLMQRDEKDKISALFSTYLFVYTLIALLIIITSFLLAYYLDFLFIIENETKLQEYRLALLIFGIGNAIAFIPGFSLEILRGMHLLRIRNYINTFFVIANLIGLWLCIQSKQPLYVLAIVAAGIQILTNFSFLFAIKRYLPSLKISKKLIDLHDVRSSLQFSLSAYMVTFSNILIFRTDQIIVSAVAGVTFAGFYQIAARVSELFRQFATQFHESLGTKAAMLSQQREPTDISALLINSNKIIAAITTLLFIPSYLLIDRLLYLWLDLSDPDTILVAQILLISMYILVVFRSSMVQILLMNNLHIQLMKVGLFEAVFNILLSIYLVHQYGMLGVALGTLIPNVLIALFYNIPTSIYHSKIKLSTYIIHFLMPLLTAIVITFYVGEALRYLITPTTIFMLCLNGTLIIILFLLLYALLGFPKELKRFYQNNLKPKSP